jgi:hypothetical protein
MHQHEDAMDDKRPHVIVAWGMKSTGVEYIRS